MVSLLPVHFFAYSGLFGATCYQSFYAGIASYKALPIEMFSKLQHRIFPGYFAVQAVLSLVLFVTSPFNSSRSGNISLGINVITALANLLLVMPQAHKIVVARDAQMEIEGKSYKDPTASDDMKLLNRKFGKLHGISMVFNFVLVASIFYYGYFFASRLEVLNV